MKNTRVIDQNAETLSELEGQIAALPPRNHSARTSNGADPRLQGLPGACHRGRQRILENIQVVGRPQQQLTKQLNAMSKPTPDSETIS